MIQNEMDCSCTTDYLGRQGGSPPALVTKHIWELSITQNLKIVNLHCNDNWPLITR